MTAMMTEHHLLADDGRQLQVLERGDGEGRPVLAHNGTPNSRLLFERDVDRAQRQGIHLISYVRPGYGGSGPQPGRTVADCAEDVRAIAAALQIERIAVWGISGGGPHALACAALLPDLVPAVAVLAACAPWDAPGLDLPPMRDHGPRVKNGPALAGHGAEAVRDAIAATITTLPEQGPVAHLGSRLGDVTTPSAPD
jgi:pimeloyl-ACP methyl ester carboxylesterase